MLIRPMKREDKSEVLEMMRVFYASDAVLHKASDEVLERDIDDCLSALPFIEGYVFDADGEIAGYSMLAISYSTEYGGICVWVEDIYIKPAYQGKGFAARLFEFIENKYKDTAVRYRLELERDNINAAKAYFKNGYTELPYMEMTKEQLP